MMMTIVTRCIPRSYGGRLVKQGMATAHWDSKAARTIQRTRTMTNKTTPASPVRLSFFAWYSQKLDTHPILTKSISAFIVTGFGNVLSQTLMGEDDDDDEESETKRRTVDWPQVGRFALLNGVMVAPALHYWYNFLNRAVPGTTLLAVAKRVFWDEFCFTPVYLPLFLSTLWALEGSPLQNIPKMAYEEVPSILVAEWTLWIPTMAFTFRYIPVKFQVLMINSVGVLWYTYLSYTAKQAHTKHGHTPLEEMAALAKKKSLALEKHENDDVGDAKSKTLSAITTK